MKKRYKYKKRYKKSSLMTTQSTKQVNQTMADVIDNKIIS